jgi:hypothetical protein
MQCTHDVTMRCIRLNIVAMEKQYVLHTLSLNYPAYNAHALYYVVIFGLSGSATFFHIVS